MRFSGTEFNRHTWALGSIHNITKRKHTHKNPSFFWACTLSAPTDISPTQKAFCLLEGGIFLWDRVLRIQALWMPYIEKITNFWSWYHLPSAQSTDMYHPAYIMCCWAFPFLLLRLSTNYQLNNEPTQIFFYFFFNTWMHLETSYLDWSLSGSYSLTLASILDLRPKKGNNRKRKKWEPKIPGFHLTWPWGPENQMCVFSWEVWSRCSFKCLLPLKGRGESCDNHWGNGSDLGLSPYGTVRTQPVNGEVPFPYQSPLEVLPYSWPLKNRVLNISEDKTRP